MQLSDRLEEKFRLDEKQKRALHRLKIFSVADLLFHFPVRYSEISEVKKIENLIPGDMATVYGKVSKLKTRKAFRSKIPMGEGEIQDLSGKIKIIWFNQAYLAKMIRNGEMVKLTGRVTLGKNGLYLANPEFEKMPDMPIDGHDSLFSLPLSGNFLNDKAVITREVEKNFQTAGGFSYPIYSETKGITSKWFYHAIEKIFSAKSGSALGGKETRFLNTLQDYIPEDILKKYHLPSLRSALIWIHKPKNKKDAESARKRFAFEEVFQIQLERQHDKFIYRKNKSFQVTAEVKKVEEFVKRFPFKPTKSQQKSIETILSDITKNFPMSRLLEGDVGSGKTAVAATAAYITVNQRPFDFIKNKFQTFGNLQVAYMAPTEILAVQHFESFIEYFKHLPINIGLITGSTCRKFPSKLNKNGWTDISRTQLLKWVTSGEIPILIGTHALIQKKVKFKDLALCIIDEQHRFGTAQRRKLVRKDNVAPHLLSMTATPIPRTLALTVYGDLDLSLLDEMPAGRKPIITEIITPNKRDETYQKIKTELKNGRQLYVICPRIFEPEEYPYPASPYVGGGALSLLKGGGGIELKSVTTEAKRLKKYIFPEYEIEVLHSKMTKIKKETVMQNFALGKTNILCATSVVEVGVNVPNATIIIIEGAERFGLAQLHQLRGRVIRSNYQAYCYIFAEAKSVKTIERLKALKTAKNGFELAELDLALRGAGELGGTKQWGITDLGMEAIKNIKMVEAARLEATRLITEDPELINYPLLKKKISEKVDEFHFE
jgi:ATP-dependent DNA helicase RecG